jgi:tRNA modification GTPase
LRLILDRSVGAPYLAEPAEVALVGPVNAGKSMLANTLASREAVVVTDLPGTTRDWVTIPLALEGVPLTLIDTAGARTTDDALEREAIARGAARTSDADLHLLVFDITQLPTIDTFNSWIAVIPQDKQIIVLNKVDLDAAVNQGPWEHLDSSMIVQVSARRGDGIDVLARLILQRLGVDQVNDRIPSAFSWRLRRRLAGLVGCSSPAVDTLSQTLEGILTGQDAW